MALREWVFNVSPAGTILTTGNVTSVDGTSASVVGIISGTGSIKSSNAFSQQGGISMEMVNSSASGSVARLTFPASHKQGALRFYHYEATNPSTTISLASVRYSGGQLFRFGFSSTSKATIYTPAGVALASSTGNIVFGQWNRFELVYTIDTATTGSATLNVYAGEASTHYLTVTVSGVNLGTNPATAIDIGTPTTTAVALTHYFDSVGLSSDSTGEVGPYTGGNSVPTANAGLDQTVASGADVALTGAGSDNDGTIVSGTWTQIGGTTVVLGGSGLVRTFTAGTTPAGEILTFSLVVTDNNGATSLADTMTVTVQPAPASGVVRNWLFNVGPSGTTLNTSNIKSVDGVAASVVGTISGTATTKSSNSFSQQGGLSMEMMTTASSGNVVRLNFPTANERCALRFYHYEATNPSSTVSIGAVRHASGQLLRFGFSSTAKVAIYNSSGVALASSASSLTFGQWNRFELVFNIGSATTGMATLNVYNAEEITPYATVSVSDADLGASPATSVDLGTPITAAVAITHYFDSVGLASDSTVEMGPYVAGNVIPVASAGSDQVVRSYDLVTLTGSGTNVDGTVALGTWTQTGGAMLTLDGAGLIRNFRAPASISGETLTFSLVVTDNEGSQSAADTVTVAILPHIEWLKTSGGIVPIRRSV